jgi:hypothetical protein
MFDELKALADEHAELHTDQTQLQAEMARPWWRRLIGR